MNAGFGRETTFFYLKKRVLRVFRTFDVWDGSTEKRKGDFRLDMNDQKNRNFQKPSEVFSEGFCFFSAVFGPLGPLTGGFRNLLKRAFDLGLSFLANETSV